MPQTIRESKRSIEQKKKKKKREVVIIGGIAIIVVVVLLIYTLNLSSQAAEQEEQIAYLQSQVDDENARTEELEAEGIYMKSKEFIEKIARERLGMVSPDETVIKPDDE